MLHTLKNRDYYEMAMRLIDIITEREGPGTEAQIQFESLSGKYGPDDSIWPDFYANTKAAICH